MAREAWRLALSLAILSMLALAGPKIRGQREQWLATSARAEVAAYLASMQAARTAERTSAGPNRERTADMEWTHQVLNLDWCAPTCGTGTVARAEEAEGARLRVAIQSQGQVERVVLFFLALSSQARPEAGGYRVGDWTIVDVNPETPSWMPERW